MKTYQERTSAIISFLNESGFKGIQNTSFLEQEIDSYKKYKVIHGSLVNEAYEINPSDLHAFQFPFEKIRVFIEYIFDKEEKTLDLSLKYTWKYRYGSNGFNCHLRYLDEANTFVRHEEILESKNS